MGGQRVEFEEAIANLDQYKGSKSDSTQAPVAAKAKMDLLWDSDDTDLQDWCQKIAVEEPRFQHIPQTDAYNRLSASPMQAEMDRGFYSQNPFKDSLQSVLQQLATTLNQYEEQGSVDPPMPFGPIGSGYPTYGIGSDQPPADEPFYIRPRAIGGVATPPLAPPGLSAPPGLEDVADWGHSLPKDLLSRQNKSHNAFGKGTAVDSLDTNFPTPRTNVTLLAGCYGPASATSGDIGDRASDNTWPYSNH
jgi:hypothetical protein